MPRQALAFKKYCSGTSPVSKISDNEHAAAALWNSEVLSVKNSVGEPIPEFCQPSEYGSKRSSGIDGQDTGDVLPYHPSGPQSASKSKVLKREVAMRIIQSLSLSCNAEGLA